MTLVSSSSEQEIGCLWPTPKALLTNHSGRVSRTHRGRASAEPSFLNLPLGPTDVSAGSPWERYSGN